MTSPSSMHETGHSKPVLWDHSEWCGGEGGRRRVQDGETHVHPWLIHFDVWQKPPQDCRVISLQSKLINFKKRKKKNGNTYCHEELVLAQVWEFVLENKRKLDIKGDLICAISYPLISLFSWSNIAKSLTLLSLPSLPFFHSPILLPCCGGEKQRETKLGV